MSDREFAARQKEQARRIALGAREISLQKTALFREVVKQAIEAGEPWK